MRHIPVVILLLLFSSCSNQSDSLTGPGVNITGTVNWIAIEGGFWAIKSTPDITYEPINLPEEFQKEGLKVILNATIREDLGSYRMVGPIIEIHTIKQAVR